MLLMVMRGAFWAGAVTTTSVSNGDWSASGTWDNGAPGTGMDVVIDGESVTLSADTTALASLTVTNGTLTFTNWNTRLTAATITLNGGALTHAPNTATATNGAGEWPKHGRVWLVCANLTINAGGRIDCDGRGYRGGSQNNCYGPGRGTAGGNGSGGAGHGGQGAGGYNGGAGAIYGITNAPVEPGSGAGGSTAYGGVGGAGGGAVLIEAGGHALVNGTISANGSNGSGRGGGGSGGSVFITCATFGGTNGFIRANGGNSGGGGSWSGGAGGGRIAAIFNDSAQSSLPKSSVTFLADGGTSDTGYSPGSVGTLYFSSSTILDPAFMPHTGKMYGFTNWQVDTLLVSNGVVQFTISNFELTVASNIVIRESNGRLIMPSGGTLHCGGDLIITNGGSLYVYAAPTNAGTPDYGTLVSVTGVLIVSSSSWIYPSCNGTNGGAPLFRVGNLRMDSGGGINADGRGYRGGEQGHGSGYGPGGGFQGTWVGGGGAHGGIAQRSYDGPGQNKTYGRADAPMDPGSGGAARNSYYPGGNGGGLVRIEAANDVTLNGTITADGSGAGYGGGAGGGVFIQCRAFQGEGEISADGQDRGTGTYRTDSGGGGGRIAMIYDTNAQAALPIPGARFSARGGAGYNNLMGGLGTLYFPDNRFLTNIVWNTGKWVVPDFAAWTVNSLVMSNAWIEFYTTNFQLTVSNSVQGIGDSAMISILTNSAMTVGGDFSAGVVIGRNGRLTVLGDMLLTNDALHSSYIYQYGTIDVGGDLILASYSGGTNYRMYVYSGSTNDSTDYGALIKVGKEFAIGSNAWIVTTSDSTNGGSALFEMANLMIEERGGINANGGGIRGGQNTAGYSVNGYGPGGGKAGVWYGSGGGHGGRGGNSSEQSGGATYGVSNAPAFPGSGGAARTGYADTLGSAGGGLVRIKAAEGVTVSGTITANGSGPGYGAGSGGAIYIGCLKFAGNSAGLLSAKGGNASPDNGSGGGGRIAVWRVPSKHSYQGAYSAAGGTGGYAAGEDGTIVLVDVPMPGTVLILR